MEYTNRTAQEIVDRLSMEYQLKFTGLAISKSKPEHVSAAIAEVQKLIASGNAFALPKALGENGKVKYTHNLIKYCNGSKV